jgi:hypothetical protein
MTWGGRATRVESASDEGGLVEAAALEAADQPPRLRGSAAIERPAGIEAGGRMGTPMPPHQKVELMRSPAASGGPQPLAVERRGEAGIGGHAGAAEFVKQEAQVGGTAPAVRHVRVLKHVFGSGEPRFSGGRGRAPPPAKNMGTAEQICQGATAHGKPAFSVLAAPQRRLAGIAEGSRPFPIGAQSGAGTGHAPTASQDRCFELPPRARAVRQAWRSWL